MDLKLFAHYRTINSAIRRLGWRKVQTKYCQIVDPINRLKRFIYCCFCKRFQEDFVDTIDVDETSVEIKLLIIFTGTMFSGDFQNFLTASILPFIRLKFPYGHRFFMDNDPKHTSHSTTVTTYSIAHGQLSKYPVN